MIHGLEICMHWCTSAVITCDFNNHKRENWLTRFEFWKQCDEQQMFGHCLEYGRLYVAHESGSNLLVIPLIKVIKPSNSRSIDVSANSLAIKWQLGPSKRLNIKKVFLKDWQMTERVEEEREGWLLEIRANDQEIRAI